MLWLALLAGLSGVSEELRYDFEDGTSQGWTVEEGSTFTQCVAATTKNLYAGNISGTYAISTLYNGQDIAAGDDNLTGSVRSPNITLTNGIVSFMQGGGARDGVYFAAYQADGTEIARSVGTDVVENLPIRTWDLSAYSGQEVYFRLVDTLGGGWGHVLVDDIVVNKGDVSLANQLVYNFEDGSQGWYVSEGSFSFCVSPENAYKSEGNYILSTLYDGKSGAENGNDPLTGSVESPILTLSAGEVTFLQGGGKGAGVYFAVYDLEGNELKKSHGVNSINPVARIWDLSAYVGEDIYFKLVDTETGGWGHVMIDNLVIDAVVNEELTAQRREAILKEKILASLQFDEITPVIDDLSGKFPEEKYPAEAYREQIQNYINIVDSSEIDSNNVAELIEEVEAFKRKVLLSNPYLIDQPLLVTVREQYWGSHCPHGTMYQNGEEPQTDCAGLKMWREDGASLRKVHFNSDGSVKNVEKLIELPKGVVRDPEVSFDGEKILFSMRRNKDDDYHLYEMNADSTGLKQLTFGRELADVDPVYMPDGKIVFASTREIKYCQCNIHAQPNMFQMDADGANIVQISRNNLADFHLNLMPDGRVMYSRWEYVDRHFGPSLGLWTSNPDGTSHQLYMGNNAWTPGAMLDGRIIPGTNKAVCIYGSCHDGPWGALAVVDRSKGMEGPEPVEKMWPANAKSLLLPSDKSIHRSMNSSYFAGGGIDKFRQVSVKYEDPYPLHDLLKGDEGGTYFLVSKTIGGWKAKYGNKSDANNSCDMGIFLVDMFGNETLVYSEPAANQSCFSPMPIAARKRPPIVPSRIDLTQKEGTMYVMDVYQGDGDEMIEVERGTVKWLRILEAPPKKFWNESRTINVDARQASPMNWNLTNNKRILGDVPVEADGSAHFKVPADRFIHFLLLDENKMMIQAMRTGTMVRPGEIAGCIGCHENRLSPPVNSMNTMALKRPASEIQPWHGYNSYEETPQLNYYTEIQPAFDRNCVSCHDYGKTKADGSPMLNLAGDLGLVFNNSYLELLRKSRLRYDGPREVLVSIVNDGPPGVLPAYSWGSHKSTLIKKIMHEHEDLNNDGVKDFNISQEDLERIISWIDCNGVYYGAYASYYAGRIPLSNSDYNRLMSLANVNRKNFEMNGADGKGSLVSFDRPELSPILSRVSEANKAEALAIINKGKAALAEHPREDMQKYETPSLDHDMRRVVRYSRNMTEEEKSQQAILNGEKHYQYRDITPPLTMTFDININDDGQNVITWTPQNDETVTSYKVEKLVDGQWVEVATVPAGQDSYQVIDPENNGENYRLVAFDENGATYIPADVGIVTVLDLNKDWNLLALPFSISSDELTALYDILPPVWKWSNQKNRYERADEIEAKEGIWVFSRKPAQIILKGNPVNPELDLFPGWNLLGPVRTSVMPDEGTIQAFKWNSQYEKLLPGEILNLGKSYWFFSKEEKELLLPAETVSE